MREACEARDPLPPGGGIYFLKGAGLTKIGFARLYRTRIPGIRGMSPVPLSLVLSITGSRDTELALHAWFRDHRHHGEWFDLPEGWEVQSLAVIRAGVLPPRDAQWRRRVAGAIEDLRDEADDRAHAADMRARVRLAESVERARREGRIT